MMCEMFGKAEGCCKGKGGAMHTGDVSVGALTANAIVGGNLPIAAGVALAYKMQKKKNVIVCFFGDGASNEGNFHEALNMASLWDLPVVYVVENNLYGMSTHIRDAMAVEHVAARAGAYAMPGIRVDGMDVQAVCSAVRTAAERARGGRRRRHGPRGHRGGRRRPAAPARRGADDPGGRRGRPGHRFHAGIRAPRAQGARPRRYGGEYRRRRRNEASGPPPRPGETGKRAVPGRPKPE